MVYSLLLNTNTLHLQNYYLILARLRLKLQFEKLLSVFDTRSARTSKCTDQGLAAKYEN